jgi:hypothetical protein
MSAWRGADGKFVAEGLPHVTKIARKPEGVGTELKSIACGQTGILTKLELMEGQERNRLKPYAAQFGEGTGIVLRLPEQYTGTGRIIHADSAFSSVKTLLALKQKGLYFMGLVKTAHREYPKAYFEKWVKGEIHSRVPRRGEFRVLQSKEGTSDPFYAVCWNDKKPKTIISNVGSTAPGKPSVRTRHSKVINNEVIETNAYDIEVPRPKMVEDFYSCFSSIDVHDHIRQGSLGFEREWYTKVWWHRVFATIYGMCIVDSYLAYKYEMESKFLPILPFRSFISNLARQLIFNIYLQSNITTRAHGTVSNKENQVNSSNL